MRTTDRAEGARLPSLTPIYRSAEFQEREIFDLYGIRFDGHPDLRRILMWDEFEDYPMRKDYREPDDYEYEPTAHDDVLERAKQHSQRAAGIGRRGESDGAAMSLSSRAERSAVEGPRDVISAPPVISRGPSTALGIDGELMEVSMGPQHPSTHGVFRMNVALEGEVVRKLKPVFGYLHRNHEKIGENTSYLGSMPYTDRLDYFCSMTNNWAYALSVEKLAGIEVPERAEYLRVILAELTRLQNHASLLGFLLSDMGAWGTPLMYAFREREIILDLFESLSGSRMMCDYMRFGGCRCDLPPGWIERARKVVEAFPRFLDEFERLIVSNEILIARTQNVGKLSRRTRDQCRHHRADAARLRGELRPSESGRLWVLSALQVSRAAGRSRRLL